MDVGKFVKLVAVILAGLTANVAYAEQGPPEPPAGAAGVEEPDLREVEPEAYYIAIVGKPMKIERLDREQFGNLEPWSIASYADFDRKCMRRCREEGPKCWKLCAREREEGGDVVISNSCGFIRTTFEKAQLAKTEGGVVKFTERKNLVVYNTVGEWCRLRDRVRDAEEGLLLGKWGRSFYELLHVIPVRGTADGWFLSPSIFTEQGRSEIEHLFVPVAPEQRVCFDPEDLWPDDRADLERSKFTLKDEHGRLCETHGLPISRVLAAYRKLGYLMRPDLSLKREGDAMAEHPAKPQRIPVILGRSPGLCKEAGAKTRGPPSTCRENQFSVCRTGSSGPPRRPTAPCSARG